MSAPLKTLPRSWQVPDSRAKRTGTLNSNSATYKGWGEGDEIVSENIASESNRCRAQAMVAYTKSATSRL